MARYMTALEQAKFSNWFPAMNVGFQPRVTGEATPSYNSVAWSVGVTNEWIDPWSTVAEWDNFYWHYRLERDGTGKVAVWGNSACYTHASVASVEAGFDWESKIGSDLRVLHSCSDLVGSMYGHVQMFYGRPGASATKPATNSAANLSSSLTDQEKVGLLQSAVQNITPDVRQQFEQLFDAWKHNWFEGDSRFNSSTFARTADYNFRALVQLGEGILPLVAEKLMNPGQFMTLQLWDILQPDSQLRVERNVEDISTHGQNARATTTLNKFFASLRK